MCRDFYELQELARGNGWTVYSTTPGGAAMVCACPSKDQFYISVVTESDDPMYYERKAERVSSCRNGTKST